MRLKKTAEFESWYGSLVEIYRAGVDARLDKMMSGYFGLSASLGDGLFELKWKNGMRVYYSRRRIGEVDSIVLLGGFKGTQTRDIVRARGFKERYENELEKEWEKKSQNQAF